MAKSINTPSLDVKHLTAGLIGFFTFAIIVWFLLSFCGFTFQCGRKYEERFSGGESTLPAGCSSGSCSI